MVKPQKIDYIWSLLRLGLGWIFLWAFLDKLFGLGFSTPREASWLAGGSPTSGFLLHAVHGPFAPFFHQLANIPFVDWIFMLGLAGVGISLLLGAAIRFFSIAGALMVLLMWSALLPPENNPFFDEHLIYLIIFIGLALLRNHTLAFQKRWNRSFLVKRFPFLQ